MYGLAGMTWHYLCKVVRAFAGQEDLSALGDEVVQGHQDVVQVIHGPVIVGVVQQGPQAPHAGGDLHQCTKHATVNMFQQYTVVTMQREHCMRCRRRYACFGHLAQCRTRPADRDNSMGATLSATQLFWRFASR